MEKNQHNSSIEKADSTGTGGFTGNQPGQQIPVGDNAQATQQESPPKKEEQHSESSFPEQEGETLGTP